MFKLSTSSPPQWAWTLVSCAIVGSFVMTGACIYFDTQQRKTAARTVKSAIDEMEVIEQSCGPASLAGTPPTSTPGEKAELVIHSAIYGAGVGRQKDVADLLRERIKDGQLGRPEHFPHIGEVRNGRIL